MEEALVPPVTDSCDAVSQDASSQAGCEASTSEEEKEEKDASFRDSRQDREGSEAVKLLDEELAELEKMMRLQRRKVDALQRLRQQWLSGERYVDVSVCGKSSFPRKYRR